jgi:hypothetical protein
MLGFAALGARVSPVGQDRRQDDPVADLEVLDQLADRVDDTDGLVADDLVEGIGEGQGRDGVDVGGAGSDGGGAHEGVEGPDLRDGNLPPGGVALSLQYIAFHDVSL